MSLMRTSVLVTFVSGLLVASVPAMADPPQRERRHELPPHAQRISDHEYDLGESADPTTGRRVRGLVHVMLAPTGSGGADAARGGDKGGPSKGGGGTPAATDCYAYNQGGTTWRTAEAWVLDATGALDADGAELTHQQLAPVFASAIATWEDAVAADIIGDVLGAEVAAEAPTQNGVNEIIFAALSPGTIAVNYRWGVYKGRTDSQEILEFDQVYSTAYRWSLNADLATPGALGDERAMDFANIATHEVGHAIGLGHPALEQCASEEQWEAQVMHWASFTGETKNRHLADGDRAGVQSLYGGRAG